MRRTLHLNIILMMGLIYSSELFSIPLGEKAKQLKVFCLSNAIEILVKDPYESEIKLAKQLDFESSLINSQVTSPFLLLKDKKEIFEILKNMNLSTNEIRTLVENLNKLSLDEIKVQRLKNFLYYVQSVSEKNKKIALGQIGEAVLDSGYTKGNFAEKFYQKENKFYLLENDIRKNEINKLQKAGVPVDQATVEATLAARAMRQSFQHRLYSCLAKNQTAEQKNAKKVFNRFALSLGLGGTLYGYTKNNMDSFSKEHATSWFGHLGYELMMTYVGTKLSSALTTDPTQTGFSRYLKTNINYAKINLVDAIVYSNIGSSKIFVGDFINRESSNFVI